MAVIAKLLGRIRRLWCSRAMRLAYEWEQLSEELSRQLREDARRLEAIGREIDDVQARYGLEMARLRKRLELIARTVNEDLAAAVSAQEMQRTVVESLRQENQVMAESTIPQLVAACRLHTERWNAEIAKQIRRQVASEAGEG